MSKASSNSPNSRRRRPDWTRQQLLDRSFEEIHRSGFRAASLDAILESVNLTKGALYHHFRNKKELGYAVVEERVRPFVEARWRPALESADPIGTAIAVIEELLATRGHMALKLGCPFNNLCQEMSPVDEGFRTRLNRILKDWREAVATGLRRGQAENMVRKDIDPDAASAFIVSSVEGCLGMAKASHSREFLRAGMQGLIEYLEHLRPSATAPSSE